MQCDWCWCVVCRTLSLIQFSKSSVCVCVKSDEWRTNVSCRCHITIRTCSVQSNVFVCSLKWPKINSENNYIVSVEISYVKWPFSVHTTAPSTPQCEQCWPHTYTRVRVLIHYTFRMSCICHNIFLVPSSTVHHHLNRFVVCILLAAEAVAAANGSNLIEN